MGLCHLRNTKRVSPRLGALGNGHTSRLGARTVRLVAAKYSHHHAPSSKHPWCATAGQGDRQNGIVGVETPSKNRRHPANSLVKVARLVRENVLKGHESQSSASGVWGKGLPRSGLFAAVVRWTPSTIRGDKNQSSLDGRSKEFPQNQTLFSAKVC